MEGETKTCPECGAEIPSDAVVCPECGSELKKKCSRGAKPVPFTQRRESQPTKDFMTLAREHKKEHNCPMHVAMSAIARQHPDLHAAFVESCRAGHK